MSVVLRGQGFIYFFTFTTRSRAFRSFGVCPRPLAQEFKSADGHGKSRRTCASVRPRALSSPPWPASSASSIHVGPRIER